MRVRIGVLAALLGTTGCFNIDVVAPHGADVTLISSKAPVSVRREYRTWFVAWGLTPLDNTMPELYVEREKLTEVRFVAEDNVPDALHGILYNILIPIGLVTQTVIVEGNRGAEPQDPRKSPPESDRKPDKGVEKPR